MGKRRGLLALGVLGMCAMAPARVRAVTTEVEGAGYAGDSPGGFGCGGLMRARYAGAGARVRVSQNEGRFFGKGLTAEGAGSVNHEHNELTHCSGDCAEIVAQGRPFALPDAWMGAGQLRGGYVGDFWSVVGGATAYNAWDGVNDRSPTLRLFPDVEVAGGIPNKFRVLAGIGAPLLTALNRPGAYLGTDFALGTAELQLRGGYFRAGPGMSGGGRADAIGLIPLASRLDLRLSAAVQATEGYAGGEGGVGFRATF